MTELKRFHLITDSKLVFRAGGNCHHIIGGICGFDAHQIGMTALPHIGHGLGFVGSRIPNDGGMATLFANHNTPVEDRVGDMAISPRIQINPVNLCGNF